MNTVQQGHQTFTFCRKNCRRKSGVQEDFYAVCLSYVTSILVFY